MSHTHLSKPHSKSRQHGLSLPQWGVLFVAFMVGVGGSIALREIFPPASVHAGVIHNDSVTRAAVSQEVSSDSR